MVFIILLMSRLITLQFCKPSVNIFFLHNDCLFSFDFNEIIWEVNVIVSYNMKYFLISVVTLLFLLFKPILLENVRLQYFYCFFYFFFFLLRFSSSTGEPELREGGSSQIFSPSLISSPSILLSVVYKCYCLIAHQSFRPSPLKVVQSILYWNSGKAALPTWMLKRQRSKLLRAAALSD